MFYLSVGNYGHIPSRASPFGLNRKIGLLISTLIFADQLLVATYSNSKVVAEPAFES